MNGAKSLARMLLYMFWDVFSGIITVTTLKLQAQNCDEMMLVKCTHEWCVYLARMLLEMLGDFFEQIKIK